MVRDTDYDTPVEDRIRAVGEWLVEEKIPGKAMRIPDIHGVYYGRKVGYEVQEVDVPEDIKQISGTKIRFHNKVQERMDKQRKREVK
jgi:hypothetical protein